jgi:hypothetical protein
MPTPLFLRCADSPLNWQGGAQMQTAGGRSIRHSVVAVGRAAAHAFEQTQHATHAFNSVERADKIISDVPGLAKQTSTPPFNNVRTRLSAPFMDASPVVARYNIPVLIGNFLYSASCAFYQDAVVNKQRPHQ